MSFAPESVIFRLPDPAVAPEAAAETAPVPPKASHVGSGCPNAGTHRTSAARHSRQAVLHAIARSFYTIQASSLRFPVNPCDSICNYCHFEQLLSCIYVQPRGVLLVPYASIGSGNDPARDSAPGLALQDTPPPPSMSADVSVQAADSHALKIVALPAERASPPLREQARGVAGEPGIRSGSRKAATIPTWKWTAASLILVLLGVLGLVTTARGQGPPSGPRATGSGGVAEDGPVVRSGVALYRGRELRYEVINGLAVHGGDMVLGTVEEVVAEDRRQRLTKPRRARGRKDETLRWSRTNISGPTESFRTRSSRALQRGRCRTSKKQFTNGTPRRSSRWCKERQRPTMSGFCPGESAHPIHIVVPAWDGMAESNRSGSGAPTAAPWALRFMRSATPWACITNTSGATETST